MKRRKPWLAFILTQICPGMGQLYNGDIRWTIIAFVLSFALALYSTIYLFDSLSKLMLAIGLGLALDMWLSIQAWLKARQIKEMQLKQYQRWWVYVLFGIVLYGVPDGYGLLIPSRIRSFQIPSESMVPNLLIGDRLVADGWAYWHSDPKRGDIIVFDYPREPSTKFVKRLIGLPGDTIEVKHGELYINSKIVPQQRVMGEQGSGATRYMENLEGVEHTMQRVPPENLEDYGPKVVPPDSYFMMGDNRDRSSDSRVWGYVKRDQIIGKMVYVYFSWDSNAYQKMLYDTDDYKAAIMVGLREDRIGLNVK